MQLYAKVLKSQPGVLQLLNNIALAENIQKSMILLQSPCFMVGWFCFPRSLIMFILPGICLCHKIAPFFFAQYLYQMTAR